MSPSRTTSTLFPHHFYSFGPTHSTSHPHTHATSALHLYCSYTLRRSTGRLVSSPAGRFIPQLPPCLVTFPRASPVPVRQFARSLMIPTVLLRLLIIIYLVTLTLSFHETLGSLVSPSPSVCCLCLGGGVENFPLSLFLVLL